MATIQASDVLPVRSRVSWAAILAGAFVAMAVYILLGALGQALGVSLSDRMAEDGLGMAAGIWFASTLLIALFCGGCVASRCTVGENKTEAVLYGTIVWGLVFTMLAVVAAGTIGPILNNVLGNAASPAAVAVSRWTDEDLKTRFGFTPDAINNSRAQFDRMREEARAVARDPRTAAAAWWMFGGIVLSMGAAIAGALVGAGPNLVITAVRVRTTAVAAADGPPVRETTVTR